MAGDKRPLPCVIQLEDRFIRSVHRLRGSASWKTQRPMEKALRASMLHATHAVLLLAHDGVSQHGLWHRWWARQGEGRCGLIVCSDKDPRPTEADGDVVRLMGAAILPTKHVTAHMAFSIVVNTAELLKAGLHRFPAAQVLALLPGTSIPIRDLADWPTVSITGSAEFTKHSGWFHGSQFMLLARRDARDIVEAWPRFRGAAAEEHRACFQHHKRMGATIPGDGPDEQYLQTLLHSPGRLQGVSGEITVRCCLNRPILFPGRHICEENPVPQPGASHNNMHARVYCEDDIEDLRDLIQIVFSCPITLAVRKVDNSFTTCCLEELLREVKASTENQACAGQLA